MGSISAQEQGKAVYLIVFSCLPEIVPGSGKHVSLIRICAPGSSAGIKFWRMLRQYLSDQS